MVRPRPPRWSDLDREGRLIALYAVLSAGWLVVMLNMMVRIYRDRVGGLVVGLWHTGPVARLLLLAIVAGLLSPIVYGLVALAGRTRRRVQTRRQQRHRAADLPRRVDALRGTSLGPLPEEQLTALAEEARWLDPRTGDQVLAAGASPGDVLVVVDGMLEGRRPGDPPGSIRSRAGAGELVGAAPALTATPSALAWTTVGTRLLAVPVRVFAEVVGPFVKQPPASDRAEAETLLDDTPALAGMSEEERLALLGHLRPVDLDPGQRVEVRAGQAAVVGSGMLQVPGNPAGGELRRGRLLGPPSGDEPLRAEARTRARVWPLPVLAGGVGALLTGGRLGVGTTPPATTPGAGPISGAHPSGDYPPLTPRPGAPPAGDEEPDRRLMRALVILALLALLLALLTGRIAALSAVPWAEMPDDRVLLTVEHGEIEVAIDGRGVHLHRGDRRYLKETDVIEVRRRSTGLLTFRGGGEVVLCPSTEVTVGPLGASPTRPIQPHGTVTVDRGALLADTESPSAAFRPLDLAADVREHEVVSDGPALFAVASARTDPVEVASGDVHLDGKVLPATGAAVACPGAAGERGLQPGEPRTVATASPSPTASPTPSPVTPSPAITATTPPTGPPPTGPPPTAPPPTTPPPAAPPDTPPQIMRATAIPGAIEQVGPDCPDGPTTSRIVAEVRDAEDGPQNLRVRFRYQLDTSARVAGQGSMTHTGGGTFEGTLGPFDAGSVPREGGTFTVTVSAEDSAGNTAQSSPFEVQLRPCGRQG